MCNKLDSCQKSHFFRWWQLWKETLTTWWTELSSSTVAIHTSLKAATSGWVSRTLNALFIQSYMNMIWTQDPCLYRERWTCTKRSRWRTSSSRPPSSLSVLRNASSSSFTASSHQNAAPGCVALSGRGTVLWTIILNSTTQRCISSREGTRNSSPTIRSVFMVVMHETVKPEILQRCCDF